MAKLTIRQLEYFDALARDLHFGRAAKAVGVTQPALSSQIAEMEATFGYRLFERGRTAVRLTERGERHRAAVERILADIHELESASTTGAKPLEGRFRLGVIPTVAPYLLPRLLPILGERFPSMQVELREAKTATLVGHAIKGDIDAFICASDLNEPRLRVETLFDEDFLMAVPTREAASISPPVPPESALLERLMLLEEGHCMRDQALAACGSVTPVLMASFGATSLTTLLQMVGHGMGVTLLPRMAEPSLKANADVTLIRFAGEAPKRTICLATRRSGSRLQDYHVLAETIRDAHAEALGEMQ